jgi:hypothetical protein
VKEWRGRPEGDAEPEMTKWMKALDSFKPPKAAGAGAVLSGLNPKNLVSTVAGATAIARTGISGGEQAMALNGREQRRDHAVLMVIIGVKLIGDAISGLSGYDVRNFARTAIRPVRTWSAHARP